VEAGFEYDSTLVLKGHIGFRFGAAYPWRLADGERRLDLLEVPPLIAEGALLKPTNMDPNPEITFEYVRRLTAAVQSVGSVLTLLWHPSSFANPEWFDLYARTLEHLDSEGAWFGTVREVGEWWRTHNEEILNRDNDE